MFGLRNVDSDARGLQSAVYLEEFQVVLKGETTFQRFSIHVYGAQMKKVGKPKPGSLTERRQSPGIQCSATFKSLQ